MPSKNQGKIIDVKETENYIIVTVVSSLFGYDVKVILKPKIEIKRKNVKQ